MKTASELLKYELRHYFRRPWLLVIYIPGVFLVSYVFQWLITYFGLTDGRPLSSPITLMLRVRAVVGVLLDPVVWLFVCIAWQSIMREHNLKRANDLALSSFTSRQLFVAKLIPLSLFLFTVLFPAKMALDLMELFSYWGALTSYISWHVILLRHLFEMIHYCLLVCLGCPICLYFYMLVFPKSRKEITSVFLSGLTIILVKYLSFWLSMHFVRFLYARHGIALPFLSSLSYFNLFRMLVPIIFIVSITVYVIPRFKRLMRSE